MCWHYVAALLDIAAPKAELRPLESAALGCVLCFLFPAPVDSTNCNARILYLYDPADSVRLQLVAAGLLLGSCQGGRVWCELIIDSHLWLD